MKPLNTLERDTLIRKIAQNDLRIKGLEAMLQGQPIRTVRFADAIITAAKIAGLSADKITSGIISVGTDILIFDGVTNRILINRDTILISKPGVEVTDTITEDNKKDFVLISDVEAHKILFAGFVTAGSYTHNLGRIPFYHVWQVDSTTSPTYFRATKATRDTINQIQNIPNPSYLLLFNEGAI